MKKIDIYNHVMPPRYLELMRQHSKDPGIVKRMTGLRMLWDLEARVQMLEKWPGLQQVLTLAVPSPEALGDASASPDFARIANDDLAAIVAKWPQRFPAFVREERSNTPRLGSGELPGVEQDRRRSACRRYRSSPRVRAL